LVLVNKKVLGMDFRKKLKGQGIGVGRVISVFVTMLVGVVLLTPFADEVAAAAGGNVTGAALSITNLLPLFFALLILLVAVVVISRRRGR
jgi:hypothetical protein